MRARLRQSWPARMSAAGFIVIILFGNLILAEMMLGVAITSWLTVGLWLGVLVTLLGGLALAITAIIMRFRPEPEHED